MSKELNFEIRIATGGAILGTGDINPLSQNDSEKRQNNRSVSKRDNRAHVYTFIKKLIRGGIEYIEFKTADGIGYCPLANIDSIKAQFDESLTLATN